jgi:hypothetical protein
MRTSGARTARAALPVRSVVGGLEDLLGRAADHHFAAQDIGPLDLERCEVVAHALGREIVGAQAPVLAVRLDVKRGAVGTERARAVASGTTASYPAVDSVPAGRRSARTALVAVLRGRDRRAVTLNAVELNTDAREASGLLAAADGAEAYWSVLDEHRVEEAIVLISRLGAGWHVDRLTGRFGAAAVRTSDGEALARHDGLVFVAGSHFGTEDDGLQARRAFFARFREAGAAGLQVWRDPFALHRLVNDALRERGIDLFPICDAARRDFIDATDDEEVAEGDWPLNVEGIAFRRDGSLLVGLRSPVSASGDPLLVELGGFATAFGSQLPPVTAIWILQGAGSPAAPAGVRDLEAEPEDDTFSVLTGCLDGELLRRADREQTPDFEHWTFGLPPAVAGGPVTPDPVRSLPSDLRRVEGLARRPDGGYAYVTDDENRVTLLLA